MERPRNMDLSMDHIKQDIKRFVFVLRLRFCSLGINEDLALAVLVCDCTDSSGVFFACCREAHSFDNIFFVTDASVVLGFCNAIFLFFLPLLGSFPWPQQPLHHIPPFHIPFSPPDWLVIDMRPKRTLPKFPFLPHNHLILDPIQMLVLLP